MQLDSSTTDGAFAAVPPLSIDLRIAGLLAGAYGLTGAIAAVLLLPIMTQRSQTPLPLPLPLFAPLLAILLTVVYGALALAGLRLAHRAGIEPAPCLTALWSKRPGASVASLAPIAGIGFGLGVALLIAVGLIARAFPGTLPPTMHPPGILAALAASTAGSFGEEILVRLFLLSGLLSGLPRGRRWPRVVAVLMSALAFGLLHTPAMVALYGDARSVPSLTWVWVVGLNAMVGVPLGILYLRRGIGAAIGTHWCCNLAWHVGSAALAN